jgi:23S rRNA pseudouridine1911/1915/1917 synthase
MTDSETGTKEKVLIVDEASAGGRLDAFLAAGMPPHVSRSRVKEIIKQTGVKIGDGVCREPNYRLKEGECITIVIPELEEAAPVAQNIPLEICHEDEHLLVINKPAGMVVHPAAGHGEGTLVNALLYHCGDTLAGIGGVKRPGIVHRLDKDTSGLLVVAKDDKTHSGLQAQFADHGRTGPLERQYMAMVWGRFDRISGTVNAHLGRSNSNRKKRAVVNPDNREAKEAITHYEVLKEFGTDANGEAIACLVACSLETGRTHQIRVHMSHIGHPLLGDQEYGKHFQTKENTLASPLRESVQAFRRQALHASVLGFEHPVTGEHMRFETPPPADFQALIDAFSI